MIGVPTGLSAALRAAIIVTATAAFFVIATRHIDLSPPPAAKLYADCGFTLALIKPGTQGRLRD